MQKLSDALMGCLEIPLFLKRGPSRFDGGKSSLALAALTLLPIIAIDAYFTAGPAVFAPRPYLYTAAKLTAVYLLFLGLYLPAMHRAAKALNVGVEFPRLVNALFWLNLSQLVLQLPLFIGVMRGRWLWEDVHPLIIFLIFYGYAYTAFMIAGVFRINWMLAAGLSILGMACGQFSHFLVYTYLFPGGQRS